MEYLIYISTASRNITQDDLLDILTVSRNNNTKNNLTGMLLYGEGAFIQVLEGETEALKQSYQVIQSDPRHYNLIKMASGELEQRNFPEWAMGFKAANADELAEFNGYINPAGKSFLQEADANAVISMLQVFADTNRM
ncbi:BLUF domain-containing protein [Mucilaginibacter lacusdianchii]|uniref:BLUF domain-containing protein n=1 Tax=Mucilaginibacter lacusdianchii TaxID=2684211 RepID=UPI00131D1119|nr:BLUF domain-containing protein [Mucilaginibacter sp. JXJ CY 39]